MIFDLDLDFEQFEVKYNKKTNSIYFIYNYIYTVPGCKLKQTSTTLDFIIIVISISTRRLLLFRVVMMRCSFF